MKNEFAPVTPREMLKEEFLAEYGLSQNKLAKASVFLRTESQRS
jgi:plasmid maintenance system antidote protein VapI